MSTEFQLPPALIQQALLAVGGGPDESTTGQRVRETSEDRPSHDSLPPLADPTADHRNDARRADVEEKHARLVQFMDAAGLEALVLGHADSVAWLTSGGDLRESLVSDRAAVLLYVTRQSRAVLADNVHSPRVFEEEVAGLGFQLKERPWHEGTTSILESLARGKKIATDLPGLGFPDAGDDLRRLRWSLTKLERQRLRELGRSVAVAVESTCRNFVPGETEADVAGHLSHRLFREGVTPVDLRVASDDRLARFREPSFKAAPIGRQAIVAATGRRHGLCASVTRIVSFGPPDPTLQRNLALAAMVDATCIYFSRPGECIGNVFRRARRIYEKYGVPHEWTLDYQGFLTGYAPRELMFRPDSTESLPANAAVRWNASVGSARSEDTIVIDDRGYEVVTEAQRWPKLEVLVKGFPIARPGILER